MHYAEGVSYGHCLLHCINGRVQLGRCLFSRLRCWEELIYEPIDSLDILSKKPKNAALVTHQKEQNSIVSRLCFLSH